jgi:hypothetical protein
MVHTLKGDFKTLTVLLDGKKLDPKVSQKIKNHSPEGFNWGYCGSGPSQLALAVCIKLFGITRALALYQDFKWSVISEIPQAVDFDIKFDEDTLQLLGNTLEVG